jgi:hypothetical protein
MSDIFQKFFPSPQPFINSDRPGKDFEIITTTDQTECMDACQSRTPCLAWSFDETQGKCWLKDGITPEVKKEGSWSGVVASRYECKRKDGRQGEL